MSGKKINNAVTFSTLFKLVGKLKLILINNHCLLLTNDLMNDSTSHKAVAAEPLHHLKVPMKRKFFPCNII